MPNKSGPIVTGALIAAGGLAAILGGKGDPADIGEQDGGVVVEEAQVREADVAPRAVRTAGGHLVRVVGAQKEEKTTVSNTDLGRVVEADIEDGVLCHVLLEGTPTPMSEMVDGMEYVGNVPGIEGIAQYYGQASWPVMISGSCDQDSGKCIWSALFRGSACAAVADSEGYLGSTMHEFLKLPESTKRRFLRTRGSIDGGTVTVPYGSEHAVRRAPVTVPHGWASRNDLNYVRAQNGQADLRYNDKLVGRTTERTVP